MASIAAPGSKKRKNASEADPTEASEVKGREKKLKKKKSKATTDQWVKTFFLLTACIRSSRAIYLAEEFFSSLGVWITTTATAYDIEQLSMHYAKYLHYVALLLYEQTSITKKR